MTGIYGCEGGVFDVRLATCPASDPASPDSIVVNYFTSDPQTEIGTRKIALVAGWMQIALIKTE